jgi:hypothetical protein
LPRRPLPFESSNQTRPQIERSDQPTMAACFVVGRGKMPFPRCWGRRIGSNGCNPIPSCHFLQRNAAPSSLLSSVIRSVTTDIALSGVRSLSTSILSSAPPSWIGRHRPPHPATKMFGSSLFNSWKSSCFMNGGSCNGNAGLLGSLASIRHKHTLKTNKSVAKRFRARGDGTLIRCVYNGDKFRSSLSRVGAQSRRSWFSSGNCALSLIAPHTNRSLLGSMDAIGPALVRSRERHSHAFVSMVLCGRLDIVFFNQNLQDEGGQVAQHGEQAARAQEPAGTVHDDCRAQGREEDQAGDAPVSVPMFGQRPRFGWALQ